jgi:molecular chaperone GrpE (heat shock protein)
MGSLKMDNMEFLKAMLAEMNAKMDANQAKAAKQEEMLKAMQEKANANRKADRVELKRMMNATQERVDANLKYLKEDIKSSQAEMRYIVCAIRSELKEAIQHVMKAVIQSIWSELDETTACNEVTDTEPDPGMM